MEIVVGAGVAGLMIAARRAAQGVDVRVFDAAPRAGGLVRSREVAGCVVEDGPQSIQATPELWAWIEELGLVDQVVWPEPAASARYLLRGGRLVALPTSLWGALTSPLWRPWDALRALLEPLVPRRRDPAPEDLHALLTRRFGAGIVRAVADAAFAGVFGGHPAGLDAEGAMPDLVAWERAHGSILRGARAGRAARPRPAAALGPMFSLRGGVGALAGALVARLGERVTYGALVTDLAPRGAGWRLTAQGAALDAERVWWAVGPEALPPSLGAPRVPYAPVVAAHVAWRAGEVAPSPGGFGWLAPEAERRDALGCLWVSATFPGHAPGHVLSRVLMGGTRDPGAASAPPDALVARARRVLAEVQGQDAPPAWTDLVVHPRGIPQVPVGHARALSSWIASNPGLRPLGWAWRGPGLSAIARDVEAAVAEVSARGLRLADRAR